MAPRSDSWFWGAKSPGAAREGEVPAGARRRWLCRLCVPRPGASRSPRTGGRGLLCAEAPTGTFGIRRSARSCHSLCFPRPETPALGAAVGNPAAGKAAGGAMPARRLRGPLPAPAPGIHGALLACRPRAPAPASPDGSPVAEGLPRPHTLLQNVPHSAWCPGHPLYGCREGGQASSQEAGEGAVWLPRWGHLLTRTRAEVTPRAGRGQQIGQGTGRREECGAWHPGGQGPLTQGDAEGERRTVQGARPRPTPSRPRSLSLP